MWELLANKVPELVVFLVLVVSFLRAQSNLVLAFTKYMADKDAQIDDIVDTNSEVIKENTEVLNKNAAFLALATHVMEKRSG